jgi:hypothetical protein
MFLHIEYFRFVPETILIITFILRASQHRYISLIRSSSVGHWQPYPHAFRFAMDLLDTLPVI